MREVYERNLVIATEELNIMKIRQELIHNASVNDFCTQNDKPFERTPEYCDTVRRLSLVQLDKKIINLDVEIEATNRKLEGDEEEQ